MPVSLFVLACVHGWVGSGQWWIDWQAWSFQSCRAELLLGRADSGPSPPPGYGRGGARDELSIFEVVVVRLGRQGC